MTKRALLTYQMGDGKNKVRKESKKSHLQLSLFDERGVNLVSFEESNNNRLVSG